MGKVSEETKKLFLEAVERMLKEAGYWHDGTKETPRRILKYYLSFLEPKEETEFQCKVFENEEVGETVYDQLIILKDIEFVSYCEHHFLPFYGKAHIGYLPGDKIIGASKMARIVSKFAKRPQIQERMTEQIADFLWKGAGLNPRGVIVTVNAVHTCIRCRGARNGSAVLSTSALRGELLTSPSLKQEFFELIKVSPLQLF